MRVVTKSITAENTFSDGALFVAGDFNFSLSGTWAATVWVQRSFDKGVTWMDVESFTSNIERIGTAVENNILYRFGVKTGGFTSGTIEGQLRQ